MSQSPPPADGFRACEVTGEVLPADSLVLFQGQWVGPRGKQILLERLQSGEPPIAKTTVRPSFWRRWGCIIVDGLILLVPSVIIELIFGTPSWGGYANSHAKSLFIFTHGMLFAGIGELFLFIISTAYFGLLQGSSGQTVGKRIGREKVVRLDGSLVDMRTGLLRGAYYSMPALILAVGLFTMAMPLFVLFYWMSILWSLVEIILLLSDSRMQRALHDRLAGTRVILLPPGSSSKECPGRP